MKVKASVSLSTDLLDEMDRYLGGKGNRSALVESAVREYLVKQRKMEVNERDRAILERNSKALNEEAEDVLSYQVDL